MESKFIKITNKEEWRDLLNKVLFKTFFHNMEWEEFLESQFRWLKFERYLYNKNCLLSLARVGDKLISHPFCEYGGPLLLADKIDGQVFQADLFGQLKNHVKISFHPHLVDFFQNQASSGLVPSGRVSYFIEENFVNLRKTTRHEIEKAKASNLQIDKCQNKKDLNGFYKIYLKSVKRHKIPAYPYSFFEYFYDSKESEIILAKKDGRVIAGSVFLFYDKFVHYFQNAVDEKYKNLGANYLILHEKIQRSLAENKIFDFGGTRVNSPLQIFKQGWGGKEHPILELKNYPAESSLRGSKLRNMFDFMPLFLIKRLSPYLLKYKL